MARSAPRRASAEAIHPCFFLSGRRMVGTASKVPLAGFVRADGGRQVSSSSEGAGSVGGIERTSSVLVRRSSRRARAPQCRHSKPRRLFRVAETHEVARKERPPHTGHMWGPTAHPERTLTPGGYFRRYPRLRARSVKHSRSPTLFPSDSCWRAARSAPFPPTCRRTHHSKTLRCVCRGRCLPGSRWWLP
jgi:hypothetical protein